MSDEGDRAELKRISGAAWARRARLAEWQAPDGEVGRIIVQLRRRGRVAYSTSVVVLSALILTILVGLAFYVGRPLYESLLDGRREQWVAQIAAQDAASTALDGDRAKLVTELVEALKWRAEEVRKSDGRSLSTPAVLPDGNGLTAFGWEHGHILRAPAAANVWTEIRAANGGGVSGVIGLPGGTRLLAVSSTYGSDDPYLGRILRAPTSGKTWEEVRTADGAALSQPVVLPNGAGLISVGTEDGRILNAPLSGETWEEVRQADRRGLDPPEVLPDNAGLIAVGNSHGHILRLDASGRAWKEVRAPDKRSLTGPYILPNGAGLIAFGPDNGHILHAPTSGETWEEVRQPDERSLDNLTILPGKAGLLALGGQAFEPEHSDNGRILRAPPSGRVWEEVRPADGRRLNPPVALPGGGGVIVVGRDDGRILRSPPSGETWEEVRAPDDRGLIGPIVLPDGEGLLVFGFGEDFNFFSDDPEGGRILHAPLPGTPWTEVRAADGKRLNRPVVLPRGEGLIATGDSDGRMLHAPSSGKTWREIRTADGIGLSDPVLLPDGSGVIAVAKEQGRIFLVSSRWSETLARLDLSPRENGDQSMKDFLQSVPATVSGESGVDAVIRRLPTIWAQRSAILTTRSAAEASLTELGPRETKKQSLSQLLAQNIPPGVLLLFLLATLSSLYRYNLRLAGFHHSRADALMLATMAERPDPDALDRFASALAADKVEFKQAATPAEQATEIAKAAVSRIKT